MFENDSWSQWQPDAERAFREHDPRLEPFASMSRAEIQQVKPRFSKAPHSVIATRTSLDAKLTKMSAAICPPSCRAH